MKAARLLLIVLILAGAVLACKGGDPTPTPPTWDGAIQTQAAHDFPEWLAAQTPSPQVTP